MSMVKIVKPLFNWLSARKSSLQIAPAKQIKTSVWRDTGQVYYMLNTLKLSYESEYGPVTFDNLSITSLRALLSELAHTQQGHLKQKVTAGQAFAYSISVCGVTWEESDDSTRVKAISEAAMLRSTHSNFVRSQAVFKHESFWNITIFCIRLQRPTAVACTPTQMYLLSSLLRKLKKPICNLTIALKGVLTFSLIILNHLSRSMSRLR